MAHDNIIRMRRVDELRPHPSNPRGPVSDDDVTELAASVREHGVLTPLLVSPDRLVIAGHRRLRAAALAGLAMVPTLVDRGSAAEHYELMVVENLQRRDLSPLQEAKAFERMLSGGMAKAELARRLAVPVIRISERLALLTLDTDTAEAFDRGDVPASALQLVRETEDPEERKTLVEELAARRTTVAKARERRAGSGNGNGHRASSPAAPSALESPARPPTALPVVTPETPVCPRCHVQRSKTIAAIDALERAEDVIRKQLGNGYVPPRPPILWTDAERRFT